MIEEVALTLKGEDIPESKEQEEFLFVTEEKLNSIETNKVKEQNRKKQKHASSWKRHSEGIDLSGIDTRSESFWALQRNYIDIDKNKKIAVQVV